MCGRTRLTKPGNDDLECGDFLNAKLKRNAELLEDEGASEVKERKIGYHDSEGRPQEQVSKKKTKYPETIANKANQGLSRGQKMIALAKFKRPDIFAQNPKMFSKTLAPTIRLNHSPPCWMKRHHFSHESEATRVKKKMAGRVLEYFFDFFRGLAPQSGGHTVVHKHFYRKNGW